MKKLNDQMIIGVDHGYGNIKTAKPGEVTPEEAHAIGVETARRMWGEEYQIVVTTHLNTDSLLDKLTRSGHGTKLPMAKAADRSSDTSV